MANTKWKRTRAVVLSGMSTEEWRCAADIRFKAIQPLSGSAVRKHLKDLVDFGFAVRRPENRVWLYLKMQRAQVAKKQSV